MMVLDECTPYHCEKSYAEESMKRTMDWARRSKQYWEQGSGRHDWDQALFAIVQGSTFDDLRQICSRELIDMDFPGYAIGGLAVGEPFDERNHITDICTDLLPAEKPRYLMGGGLPEDILPEAAWVGFYIEDDRTWEKVKNGEYKMFSIEGQAVREEV